MHITFKSKMMRWTGPWGTYGGERNAYRSLLGKYEGKRLLERRRSRWENNIKMHLTEVVCKVVDWTNLVQGKNKWRTVADTIINTNARNFVTS
jgi:hypothetical protein